MIESRWGRSWQIQVLAALACVVAFALVGRGRRSVHVATAMTSAALSLTLTRTGHAAALPIGWRFTPRTVLGAGMWLGTLTTLVALRRSLDQAARQSVFRAFSRVALTGAAMLVTAGMIASWWYVGAFANLWSTVYGRVLLGKVALVGGVVALRIRQLAGDRVRAERTGTGGNRRADARRGGRRGEPAC